jgi:mRNA interferase MazF
MYEQRDIILIPFPYSDLTTGKQRPALIISNKKINKTEDRICCLITSKAHKDDLAITKESFKEGSLQFKSFVKAHRIFTIHEGIIKKKLCTLNEKFHDKVVDKLNEYVKNQ